MEINLKQMVNKVAEAASTGTQNLQKGQQWEASLQSRYDSFTKTVSALEAEKNISDRELKILKAKYQNRPILTYPEQYYSSQEFLNRVVAWTSFFSVRDLPDRGQLHLIKMLFINEIGGMTFEEIDVAMWMNTMGEFGQKIQAYNRFDLQFLAQLIVAYKEKRTAAEQKYRDVREKLALPEQKPLTELQKDLIITDGVIKTYEKYLRGDDLYGKSSIFDLFLKLKVIKMEKLRWEERKESACAAFRSLIAGTTDLEARESMVKLEKDAGRHQIFIENRVKEQVIDDVFLQMKEKGIEFHPFMIQKFMDLYQISAEQLQKEVEYIPAYMWA